MELRGLSFREQPDREPSGKTTILGLPRCSAERMRAYAERRNPKVPDVAESYLRFGLRYGVRGDVAYCQMLYDTRVGLTDGERLPWRSQAPLLRELGGAAAQPDSIPESWIEMQMQWLYAFA